MEKLTYNTSFPHGKIEGDYIKGKDWNFKKEETFDVVGCIIVNSYDQILLSFNKKRACWDIPQGVVEKGETLSRALIRELYEEINLTLSENDIELISSSSHQIKSFVKHWNNHLFIIKNNDIILNNISNNEEEKNTDLKWFSPTQIPFPRGLSLRLSLALIGH